LANSKIIRAVFGWWRH